MTTRIRPLTSLRAATTLGVAAFALGVSGCGSSSSSGEDTAASTRSAASTTTSTASPPATTAAAAPAASGAEAGGSGREPVELDETISDPVLGHRVELEEVVRDFPAPERLAGSADGTEYVLVKAKMTSGEKTSDTLDPTSFGLLAEDDTATGSSYSGIDDEVAAAGFDILDEGPERGESAEGWLVFRVFAEGADDLTFRYERPDVRLIGSGREIPGEDYDVELPE